MTIRGSRNQRAILSSFVAMALMFAVYILLLYPSLHNPPWEVFERWRQSDTYSVAAIYMTKGIHLFAPEFYYDGIGPNTVQLELEILPSFAVLLAKNLSLDLVFSLRIISLTFFLLSAVYCLLIARLYMGSFPALVTTGIYLLAPLNVFASRAIMPEALLVFFYLGAVYNFFLFYRNSKKINLYISALMMAFAINCKPHAGFFGLVVIILYLKKYGLKALKSIHFYMYGIISLVPSALYYVYMGAHARHRFVSGLAGKHIFSEEILQIFSKNHWMHHYDVFKDYFGIYFLVLFFVGVFCVLLKKEHKSELILWAATSFLQMIIICGIIQFIYYYILLIPVMALFIGVFLDAIPNNKVKALITLLIIGQAYFIFDANKSTYLVTDQKVDRIMSTLQIHAGEKPVGVNTTDPSYINGLKRYGARMGMDYYDFVPTDPEEELDYWMHRGIETFILLKDGNKYPEFEKIYRSKLKPMYEDQEVEIYGKND